MFQQCCQGVHELNQLRTQIYEVFIHIVSPRHRLRVKFQHSLKLAISFNACWSFLLRNPQARVQAVVHLGRKSAISVTPSESKRDTMGEDRRDEKGGFLRRTRAWEEEVCEQEAFDDDVCFSRVKRKRHWQIKPGEDDNLGLLAKLGKWEFVVAAWFWRSGAFDW
ncbi:hypothetical protein Leryth_024239 [Lithospermum erythrorhizon]|nr:hypothetical protein Leryth_024239 [Lithospermum erythrorhizon]